MPGADDKWHFICNMKKFSPSFKKNKTKINKKKAVSYADHCGPRTNFLTAPTDISKKTRKVNVSKLDS